MAETKKNILTYEGLKALEDELHELKVNRRREVAQKIKEAREQGDLSENAEYDAAKENAEVVDDNDGDSSVINVGCTVTIKDLEFNEEMEYKIVGSTEADSLKGKISNESPIGSAILGAKKNQVVEVQAPAGVMQYKVLSITK